MTTVECFKSLFQWNNETLNVWTHFLTLLFFFWKFHSLQIDLLSDPGYWPLLAHAIGAFAYPALSTIAHAFSSMPLSIRHLCFCCDYAGISIYSMGSSVAYFAYSTPKHVQESLLGELHQPINFLMAVFCCFICCVSRDKKWQTVQTTMRTLSFALPYIFTCSFVIYGILVSYYSKSMWFHCSQFFWCTLMAVTMTAKIPEKYFSEYFDVVGHSHQWFHIFVFIATNHQINAVILDMQHLRESGSIKPSSFIGTVGLVVLVIAIDAVIVGFFFFRLKSDEDDCKDCKCE